MANARRSTLPPHTRSFHRNVSSSQTFFVALVFSLRFCSQLAWLWFVHSMKLCKTRSHRRHRIISRFNCKCSRIVCACWRLGRAAMYDAAFSLSLAAYAFHVKLNYDIVLNGVCLCYMSTMSTLSLALLLFISFVVCVCAVVDCGNVLFIRAQLENNFLRISAGLCSDHKSRAHIYGSERSITQTHCPNSNANAMSLAVLNSNISSYFIFLPFGRRSQCFLILVSFHELNCACIHENWVRLSFSAYSMNPRFWDAFRA